MKPIINLLILVSLLTACSSNKRFTSRKYTSGRYVSNTVHKQKAIRHSKVQKETVLVNTLKEENYKVAVLPNIEKQEERNESVIQKENRKITKILKNQRIFSEPSGFNKGFKNTRVLMKDKKSKISADENSSTNKKSVVSVFFSAAGILFSIAALYISFLTTNYFFLYFSAIGLLFGIVGLVLGIMGLNDFNKERKNGNKSRSSLVLGIVGTALGGAAIIAAFYFAFLATLFSTF